MSIRSDPAVCDPDCAVFGFQLEKVREERALGEGMELWRDVVVDTLDEPGEFTGMLAR